MRFFEIGRFSVFIESRRARWRWGRVDRYITVARWYDFGPIVVRIGRKEDA